VRLSDFGAKYDKQNPTIPFTGLLVAEVSSDLIVHADQARKRCPFTFVSKSVYTSLQPREKSLLSLSFVVNASYSSPGIANSNNLLDGWRI
jgi:hypothetical protein